MAQKIVYVEGVGDVLLSKRRGTTHLRLSINAHGQVRVGLPHWTPYAAGIAFARSRNEWIAKQLNKHQITELRHNDRIGKSNRLKLVFNSDSNRPYTKITNNQIAIKTPWPLESAETQKLVIKASNKALKAEAEHLLPQRLKDLADRYRFSYKSVEVKKLSSRWGSCNNKKQIKLSFYLMQLPWHLIDYVILHELAHTEHLNHGQKFWTRLESVQKDAKKLRKEINTYKPGVFAQ